MFKNLRVPTTRIKRYSISKLLGEEEETNLSMDQWEREETSIPMNKIVK